MPPFSSRHDPKVPNTVERLQWNSPTLNALRQAWLQRQIKESVDPGLLEIAIDEQNRPFQVVRHRPGETKGHGGPPFAAEGAGDTENRVVLRRYRSQQAGMKRPEGLPNIRLPQHLGHDAIACGTVARLRRSRSSPASDLALGSVARQTPQAMLSELSEPGRRR